LVFPNNPKKIKFPQPDAGEILFSNFYS